MTYTGRVTVDGEADVRTLDELEIRKLAVGRMANNAYLLTCRVTGDRALVDAAAEPRRLVDLVGDVTRLTAVLTTHRHHDHVGALAAMVRAGEAPVVVGAPDADAVEETTGVRVGRRIGHGDVVQVGRVALEVIALRGHTPGSVALAYREPDITQTPGTVPGRVHLLTGDSLFPGGVGSTQHDAERFTRLLDDVTRRVFDRFRDDTWVYPGHGDDTTLGVERPHLAEWRTRGW